MASRYNKYTFIQPTRTISPAMSDIIVTFGQFDNVDNLAQRYYGDSTLGWIIMCANPDHFLEFEIPADAQLRIPFPLDRVWAQLGEEGEI